MSRTDFTFVSEPRHEVYRRLLNAALNHASVVGLVIRQGIPMAESASRALDRLSPHKLSEEKSSSWPGTRLASGSELVMRYRFNSAVADALGEIANGLFDWCAPGLPEDLFLTRPSGDVWLGTIAHEKDAYLSLTEPEYAALVLEVPEVAAILRLS